MLQCLWCHLCDVTNTILHEKVKQVVTDPLEMPRGILRWRTALIIWYWCLKKDQEWRLKVKKKIKKDFLWWTDQRGRSIECLSLMRFWCLFVSRNGVRPYYPIVVIQSLLLVLTSTIEYSQTLWNQSIVWCCFGHKHQNVRDLGVLYPLELVL